MTVGESDPFEGSDKYRTIRELGRGGMGEVFLAEHLTLGHQVVIKLLHPGLTRKGNLADRMRLEAQSLARLNHPNIVRVTDFDKTANGRPYVVMEYLAGAALGDWVQERGGSVTQLVAIDVMRQALAGLDAAHAAGLVHRDIKLDNLFVCDAPARAPQGQPARQLVKLLDFGVAKVVDSEGEGPAPLAVPTGTGVVVGTPRFFAPEQARGRKIDHRVDIYAIGLVLYSMLAGCGPFDEHTNITDMARAHVYQEPKPPSAYASQPIDPDLDAVVLRCIAKTPEQRFQSAAELSLALERIASRLTNAASLAPNAAQAAPSPAPNLPAHVAGAAQAAASITPMQTTPLPDSGSSHEPTAKMASKGQRSTDKIPARQAASAPVVQTEYLPESAPAFAQVQGSNELASAAPGAPVHPSAVAAQPAHGSAHPSPHPSPGADPSPVYSAAPYAAVQSAHAVNASAGGPVSTPVPLSGPTPTAASKYSAGFIVAVLFTALLVGGAVAVVALKML